MATVPGVPARPLPDAYALELWSLAILFFVLGDGFTTGVGHRMPDVAEAGPLPAVLLSEFGLVALFALKIAILVCAYLVWTVLPREYAAAIPVAIALLGFLATVWNATVLLRVTM